MVKIRVKEQTTNGQNVTKDKNLKAGWLGEAKSG